MLAMISLYGYQLFFADNVLVDKPNRILYIPKDADFKQVADSLENGFLHDRLSFMFISKLLDYRDNVKPGRYEIKTNTNNFSLIRTLKNGRQTPLRITFNNLRTKQDFVQKVGAKMNFNTQHLADTLNNSDYLLAQFGFNDTTIVAMFIPNTYEVYWTFTVNDFLQFFHKEYKKFWNNNRLEAAQKLNLTTVDVTILASIVEAETKKDEEKPRIAGVYLNRLRAGQRLQADPTVIFATGDFFAKRVNEYHTFFPSPYNTYRKKGLPPGPINFPSIASIDAVLNAEQHDYFFFCASPDLSGYHLFSKTFEEHKNVARNYWKKLNEENIHQEKRLKNQRVH